MARPGLTARLDGDYRVALVSAPAGYGKTATLASWAAHQPDEVAWFSCDPMDAEPTRFMSCLLTAISTRWPGVADDAFVLLEREGADTYDSAVAVANELATVGVRGTIVVDDLHLAAPAPTMLTAFIDALPEGFRFVAGTRSDPPLSLARWRLRGELLEFRGDDLRFAPQELSEFLELQDVAIDDADLERLHELTEGWPAGAQLAAIALQRGDGRGDFLAAFAGTDRAVGDFLLSEVLASLPPDLVDFLVETSVLDAFDAELCVAVTGVEASALLLDRLIAANLFVVELDDPPRWLRYHHLFGAFLRARLASLGASRLRAANDRASRALEARGHVDAALRHAMAMGDVDRVSQILRGALARSMSMSDGAADTARAVRLWLHERGAAAIETDPAWVLEMLIGLISISRPDDAPSWLERVRQAHPDADGPLTAFIEGAWGEHLANRGQPLEAIGRFGLAMDAVGGAPPNVGLLPLMHVGTARAHIQCGQMDQARAVLQHARAHPVGHPVADEVRNRGVAAFVAANDGELVEAAALVRAVEESAGLLGLGPLRARAALRRAGDGRGAPRARRAGACTPAGRRHPCGRRAEPPPDGAGRRGPAARQVGPLRSVTWPVPRRSSPKRGSPTGSRTPGCVRCSVRRRSLRRCGSTGEGRVAHRRARSGSRRDAGADGTPCVARRTTTGRPPGCWPIFHRRPLGGPGSSGRCCARSACWSATSTRPTDIWVRRSSMLSRSGWSARSSTLGPEVHKLLVSFTPSVDQEVYVEALLAAAGRSVAPLRANVSGPWWIR